MSAEPDLQLEGFQLWIHGRQFPDLTDYWDANWLNVTARMEADGAQVESSGPFLRNTEILEFSEEVRALYGDLKGSAELRGLEPDLRIQLNGNGLGAIEATVELTPDHLTQRHKMTFTVDQTYLPSLSSSCDAILAAYPVLGTPDADK